MVATNDVYGLYVKLKREFADLNQKLERIEAKLDLLLNEEKSNSKIRK